MKRILQVLLAAVLAMAFVLPAAGCNENADGQTLSGQDLKNESADYIKWEGRYEFKDTEESRVYLYHTATGFTIDFVGTELKVRFYSEVAGESESHYPYYNVAVDDETLPNPSEDRIFRLTGGEEEITVVSGLDNGPHTVQCLKMSEPYDAVTAVVAFSTDGKFTERDVEADKMNFRFMFVCASGGSGHGSLGYSEKNGSHARTTKNSSSLHAFNYLTARMFGADVQFVANSGWGVAYPTGKAVTDVMDYTGITTSNNIAGAKTTAKWDYDCWVPDVIIFNIGGNDTVQSGFDLRVYKSRVVELVENLHEHYPSAKMIWTHTESNAGSYAVSALTDAGILSAGYLVVGVIPKVGADGTYGANGHNSMQTHIDSADILSEILIEEWGYTAVRQNVTLSQFDSMLEKF